MPGKMTVTKLVTLRNENFFSGSSQKEIDLFLQAVNDWPHPIETMDDYFSAVKVFLKADTLNYETIDNGMRKLNPEHFAWEMESLSSLAQLAGINKNEPPETFIKKFNIPGTQ